MLSRGADEDVMVGRVSDHRDAQQGPPEPSEPQVINDACEDLRVTVNEY